jgi:hypothetical protein
MSKFNKAFLAIASTVALGAAGEANAYLTNWYLDSDGAGANTAVEVQEYVDLNGRAYIHNTFTGPGTFNFNEAGTFVSNLVDSSTSIVALNSTFTGTGSGVVGSGISFSAGALNIYAGAVSAANLIGTFVLSAGEGSLSGSSLVPNGQISLVLQATYLKSGYFFRDAAGTQDLSTEIASGLFFGFASTNASTLSNWGGNGGTTDTSLTNLYNANFDPDITHISNDGQQNLVISNNGQFRLQVPEPTSLALLGLGLAGLASVRRRKS